MTLLAPRAAGAERLAARAAPSFSSPAPEIILDLSRLLSRILHPAPTGVDRVEMAYVQGLLRRASGRLSFVARHPGGLHGRLHAAAVEDFVHLTAERWDREGEAEASGQRWARAARTCLTMVPAPIARLADAPRAYLHLSARGLEQRRTLERLLKRTGAKFVPFVHDLIPLEHPEYARPGQAGLYARKLETLTALASGVLCNSNATARAVEAHFAARGRLLPVCAAPLGTAFAAAPSRDIATDATPPYFLMLGTIEPRKNHLLALHLWRRMIAQLGRERVPHLILVGRRGWENEMVLDLLERTPGFQGVVHEQRRIPDAALRDLIRGARAVLMPSFAEGYGLPVVESLALGAPVIASDLPALREAGAAIPDYIDPLDGAAWASAILDYADPSSPRRQAQLRRMTGWRPPSWDDHLDTALDFVARVCR